MAQKVVYMVQVCRSEYFHKQLGDQSSLAHSKTLPQQNLDDTHSLAIFGTAHAAMAVAAAGRCGQQF